MKKMVSRSQKSASLIPNALPAEVEVLRTLGGLPVAKRCLQATIWNSATPPKAEGIFIEDLHASIDRQLAGMEVTVAPLLAAPSPHGHY